MSNERRFHRRDVDFTVALPGVSVADLEQRALRPNRDVQRRTRDELLVIEIPRVNSRWRAVHATHRRRRRDADASEEWMQRNRDAAREVSEHAHRIELDDLRARCAREVFAHESTARPE